MPVLGRMMANSSPPIRPGCPCPGCCPESPGHVFQNLVAALWPKRSLTVLK
jgi:hypothetical protein